MMNKINVTKKEQFKQLYNDSAFTFEGLTEENFETALDWVDEIAGLHKRDIYVTKGEEMNKFFFLTGDNAYPDDLNIVSIKLADMKEAGAMIFPKLQVGARWFDDIVDNNERRQAEKEKREMCVQSYFENQE